MVRLAKTATMIFIATNIMSLFIIIHSEAGEFHQVNLIDKVDKRNKQSPAWHK